VAEIQENIIKQSKRNAISRYIHAKNDKEKIAAWGSDLTRILHVFNVRSIVSIWLFLTVDYQTELAIHTHVTVSETHAIVSELEHNATNTQIMVSEIHRTVVKGQEDGDNRNLMVSDTHTSLAITECPLTVPQTRTRSGI